MFKPLRTAKVLAVSAVALLGIACSSATAAPPVVAAPPQAPGPAMWVIRDADSTIYLFGTVHLLRPETKWRTPKFEAALASADELWFEITDGDDAANMQSLVMSLGVDQANPLSKKLTPEQFARLKGASEKVGLPIAGVEMMKPWLAAVTLSVLTMVKSGFDPNSGVDSIIKKGGEEAKKPLKAFETSEQQLRFFDSLPVEMQVEFLMSSIDELDESADMLDGLVKHWAVGDIAALETDLVSDMKGEYPDLYKVLLVDRNAAWAKVLAERLKGSGVSFVSVGSAHLIGNDSVQTFLAKEGVKAERY
ncbi:TraB/GumN family protein [Caulobacter sp. NIBR1757]|uniref:TraB/GumN family protein n=1 Tax=Caulobacter sp. NIBR1757 TaxID=3016000 RepID=UPI0022F121E1|nr:TraB/GumN family protein [Caulobacter sp. NIBR1757]WGM39156.1 hypothetical protein AMEJIAPC_02070 [Caulobacter sp. NIBR1757]